MIARQMRSILPGRSLLVAGLVLCGAIVLWTTANRSARPPRIVFLVVDTLRSDFLSSYGADAPTPNIDALAARGQVFTNSVSAFTQTSMSMAALFTGHTPSISSGDPKQTLPWTGKTWCGMARFATGEDDACVPKGLPTLAESLRDAGYHTAAVVSNPLLFRPSGYDRGFEDWIEVGGKGMGREEAASGPFVNAQVRAWLRSRSSDEFFLYLHFMDAHDWQSLGPEPCTSPTIRTAASCGPWGNASPEAQRDARRLYREGVIAADQAVGDAMAILEEEKLLEDAVVVLVSDHGEALGETHPIAGAHTHLANPAYQPVVRVPLIIAPATSRDSAAPVRGDDVFRIVRELAGIENGTPPPLAPGEVFYTETHFRTYVDGTWKSLWPRPNAGNPSNTAEYFRTHSLESPLLFDLATDPAELHDVSGDHPEIVATHRARVDELTRLLSTAVRISPEIAPDDRERMRALGYLD